MIPLAAMHGLRPVLAGLFLMAQLFGVVSLMSHHTAHVVETEFAATTDAPPGDHYRGDADGFVQHHELQDLSGALACAVPCCPLPIISVTVTPPGLESFTSSVPALLERPPKPTLSV
jgi:hypothetical protein